SPAEIPWLVTATTSAAVDVPFTTAGVAGQGGFPPVPQKWITMPPVIPGAPRWMCAAVGAPPSSASYTSSQVSVPSAGSGWAIHTPLPVVEMVTGVSFPPLSFALKNSSSARAGAAEAAIARNTVTATSVLIRDMEDLPSDVKSVTHHHRSRGLVQPR